MPAFPRAGALSGGDSGLSRGDSGLSRATGLLTLLAALIPLVETGRGKEADCMASLASVRRGPLRAGPGNR